MGDEWKVIDEQIERSKIRRVNWKAIFGKSLTHVILEYKERGFSSDQVYSKICGDENLKIVMVESGQAEKMLKNIKISVAARFGENNSFLKMRGEK